MNLPNLPTDNLYKFLALFGLALLISSNVIYFLFADRLVDKAQTYLRDSSIVLYDQKMTRQDKTDIQIKLNELKIQLQSARVKEKQKILNDIQIEQTIINTDTTKLEGISKTIIDINYSLNSEWFKAQAAYVIWILYIGTYGGLSLSIVGFILWYIKLQRYQDKLLKQKAEK
jgi:hypothetical protein